MKEKEIYTLAIFLKNKQIAETKHVTLKAIDERTIGFLSKEEYLKDRLQYVGEELKKIHGNFDEKDLELKIRHYTNKKNNESHIIEEVLFNKDRLVLNAEYIKSILLNYCNDPDYVIDLASKYKSSKGLYPNYLLIKNTINEPNKFSQHFMELMDKVLKTHKTYRDVYIFTQEYKKHKKDIDNFKEEKFTPISSNNSLGIYESDDEYLNYLLSRNDEAAKSEIIERYGAEYLNIHNIPIVDGAEQPKQK